MIVFIISFFHQQERNASGPRAAKNPIQTANNGRKEKNCENKKSLVQCLSSLFLGIVKCLCREDIEAEHARDTKQYDTIGFGFLFTQNDSITSSCMLQCPSSRKEWIKQLSGPSRASSFTETKSFVDDYIIWILSTWNFLLFTDRKKLFWVLLLKIVALSANY